MGKSKAPFLENAPDQQAAYRVLLIEDDPKQTDLYSELIREVSDCQIDVISRVDTSFDWVSRFGYHLVVIDTSSVVHPLGRASRDEMASSGLTLLENVKRMSPVTSVILISDTATVEEAVAAIRMGAEDYLKKPFNLESFQLAVKRGLDRKKIFGENTGASSYLDLLNACQMISASLEQKKIFGIIQSYLSRELKAPHAAIYRQSDKGLVRIERVGKEERSDRAMEEILDIALHATNPTQGFSDLGINYRFIDRGQLTPALFIFRFRCAGASDYYYICLSPERPEILEAFENRLQMLKAQIEVTGKNIEQYMGVQHLAYVDDATGLYNTRYLNYILEREISQAESMQKSFAVLFIDADRFKSINDQHGHLVGTRLLNELGHHVKKYVRDSDTVFRYGGDEFVAVLSPCDLSTAQVVAERIRQSVEQTKFLAREGLNIHFTVSIGVALFPDHAKTKKAIIDAADQAMYTVKRSTRNSVFLAPLDVPKEGTGG